MTLDGFAAGPNDEMDWLPAFNDEALWKDIHEDMWKQLGAADTLLLGRVTYQIWEKYWPAASTNPNSTDNDIKFSRYADETQKVVFSSTLEKVEWKNTTLVKGDVAKEVSKLKQEPGKNIALAGGPGLARTFIKMGLIDEYRINVHPVILGAGKPLLKDLNIKQKLQFNGAKVYISGAVGLNYELTR